MEKLNKANISKVEPASYSTNGKNILREDKVKKFPDTTALLNNVPEKEFNFIKVKKAME